MMLPLTGLLSSGLYAQSCPDSQVHFFNPIEGYDKTYTVNYDPDLKIGLESLTPDGGSLGESPGHLTLNVAYRSSESSVAIVDGFFLTVKGVGTSTISAHYFGDPLNCKIEFTLVVSAAPVQPANNILYVNKNVSGGNQSGDSWANAIPELRDALSWAATDWDATTDGTLQIWVAEGIYTPTANPTDRNATFQLVNGVELYGGFDPANGIVDIDDRILPSVGGTGGGQGGTILSGDIDGNDNAEIITDPNTQIVGSNSYTVVNGSNTDNTALLDGFTITAGYAQTCNTTVNTPGCSGAGIFNNRGSPTLSNTLISGNRAAIDGGGIYNQSSSSPTLTNVYINNNTAGRDAGGICNLFSSSPTLTNVIITDNTANQNGGGMYNRESSPGLTNMTITDNTANRDGGGMYNIDSSSSRLTNVTITNNTANTRGGGMFNITSSSPILTNVTIAGNTATDGGGMYNIDVTSSPSLTNSIIWDTVVNSYTAQNSIIIGDNNTADGNIDATNLMATDIFTDPTNGDYTLASSSPAINAGNNAAYTAAGSDLANDLDLAGNPRVYDYANGGIIDIGAYEYQGIPVPTITGAGEPEAVHVDYGTAMEDIEGLPTAVPVTLSDGSEGVSVALDENTANWVLLEPSGGAYDGDMAGTYVFAVPLVLPEEGEEPYFTNPDNLRAEVSIVVNKGIPVLTVSWNGVDIHVETGLSLTYGDVEELAFGTSDPEGNISYVLGYDGPPVLDMDDLGAVSARRAGTAVLTVQQAETANYEAVFLEFNVTVEQKAITIVPEAGQGKVYGSEEPAEYGYELAVGDALAFDDVLTDIVSGTSREPGENVGTYAIKLAFDGGKAGNYAITFGEDNVVFTVTPLEITVTAEDQSKVFGADDPNLTYAIAPELIGNDELTGEPIREPGENVGTYAIIQGNLSAGDNYEITFVDGTLTITPANLDNITFDDGTFTYDGTEHFLAISGQLPEGTSVTYQNNGRIDAGTQTVTAQIDGGVNYGDLELTATLTVLQTSQEIVFNPIPVQNLESTSGFSLQASATSGLPVEYTYVFGGSHPAATVTPNGEVTLFSSGEITITAHQEGNNNFLPATPVTQTLRVSSGDASLHVLHIGNKTHENPGPETGYLVDCGNMAGSVQVEVVTEANAVVNPGHRFTINVPQPGIYTERITVTSEDGTATKTYFIKVEKQFSFEDIVIQKFDNVLLINNNQGTNGGYEFVAFKWYRNGSFIGDGQYYSAGDNAADLLDPNAFYEVEMTTKDGEVLRTCAMQPKMQHSGKIIVYPNPVVTGNTVNIQANIPEEDRQNTVVKVYNLSGREIKSFQAHTEKNMVQVSGLPPGVYILRYQTDRLQKSFKVIVK